MKWETNVVFMKTLRGTRYNRRFQDTFSTSMMRTHWLGQQVGYKEVSHVRRKKTRILFLPQWEGIWFFKILLYISVNWCIHRNIIQASWWAGFLFVCLFICLIKCDNISVKKYSKCFQHSCWIARIRSWTLELSRGIKAQMLHLASHLLTRAAGVASPQTLSEPDTVKEPKRTYEISS